MAENKRHWLRKESTDQTKASFPERFFDLVFVFAVIQLSKTPFGRFQSWHRR